MSEASERRAEDALRRALERHAGDVEPRPLDLPTRRRAWPVLAAAAAVVAVVTAVGVGVAVVGDDVPSTPAGEDGTPSRTTSNPSPDAGGSVHAVSYRDVEVELPAAWGDDITPEPWCLASRGSVPATPYVEHHEVGLGVDDVGCINPPQVDQPGFPQYREAWWQPRLRFAGVRKSTLRGDLPPDGDYTHGTWTLAVRTLGDVRMSLPTDQATAPQAEAILDAAGCETTSPVQASAFARPEPARDVTELTPYAGDVAVCLYDRQGTDRPGLLGSRGLTGAEAARVVDALVDGPIGGGPDTPNTCLPSVKGGIALVLRVSAGGEPLNLYGYVESCYGNGFDDGTTQRALTPESCAPLWGGRVVQWSGSSAPYRVCHPES